MIPQVTQSTGDPQSQQLPRQLPVRSDQEVQIRTDQVGITVFCNDCKSVIPKTSMCGRCKAVYYCNDVCQKKDWPLHKLLCSPPKISSEALAPFKSKMEKIGNQQMLVYSLDPSYLSPKESLFKLSDFAEHVGIIAMKEFVRRMGNMIEADSILQNKTIPIDSSGILKVYTGYLNDWIKEAELDPNLSSTLSLMTKLKTFIEKYFNQPGHETLKVNTGNLMQSVMLLHEEMVVSLWHDQIQAYPDYKLKNVCDLIKKIPQNKVLELNCIAFAFLRAGEKKFDIYSHSHLEHLLKNLRAWNYCPVSDPQEGDLIVYFDVENKPKHLAFLASASGTVYSKPGLRYTFAIEHSLNHLSSFYGKGKIAFFHKNTFA